MTWYTNGNSGLITDGDRLVGSVIDDASGEGGFRVEILWSAPGGDIIGTFDSFEKALCFIEGVERTIDAFKRLSLPHSED